VQTDEYGLNVGSGSTHDSASIGTNRVGSRICHDYFASHGIAPLAIRGYPWVAKLPEDLFEAARTALLEPVIPPTLGLTELRARVAAEAATRYGEKISPGEVVITAGAMAGLQVLWSTLRQPHGNVVVPVPSYFSGGGIELAGQSYRPVQAITAEYGWDWEKIESAIDATTTALYLVNPNNPTGNLLSQADFTRLAQLSDCWPHLWTVLDESYEALAYPPAVHLSGLRYLSSLPRAVVVGSFSKSFALPWLRVGFIIAPILLVPNVGRTLEWTTLYGSYITQRIALSALEADRSWLIGMVEEFRSRRDHFVEILSLNQGLAVQVPIAGPFVYPKVIGRTHLGLSDVVDLWSGGLEAIPAACFGSRDAALRIPFGGTITDLDTAAELLMKWRRSFPP
jgi:aminotransferase